MGRRCVMLTTMNVKNFALIDDLDMTFETGLTALTGETGTGKTIILESLQLLFGKRSDAQMIRHGATKADVIGSFHLTAVQAAALDLPQDITISRTIDQSGRHQLRINDQVTTLQRLKEVTQMIGSIHNQHETMLLDDKFTYLVFIDQVDAKATAAHLNKYLMARSDYLSKKRHLESLKDKKTQSLEKQSFLTFQLQELESFNLVEGEQAQLEDKIEKLKHYDRLTQQLRLACQGLSEEGLRLEALHESGKALEKIAFLDQGYGVLGTRLMDSYYDIEDVRTQVTSLLEALDFDETAFDAMQARSHELAKIEQKYGKNMTALIAYLQAIREELALITDYDGYLLTCQKEVDDAFAKAVVAGKALTASRKELAARLEKQLLRELADLDLDKASFEIVFEQQEENVLLESGLDTVEFMISLNEGEPVKPLAKVASGGERARFMFALKSIYAKANGLSMLILDEIDIGISGKTAAKVAGKMQDLAKTMQLLVITHLPQVAARADHHYGIEKVKADGRMVTRIEHLTADARIEKIALMLSDEKLSHHAIEQAKMLLGK